MVVHAFNARNWEAEAGGHLSSRPVWSIEWVPGHPGIHKETLPWKKKVQKTKKILKKIKKKQQLYSLPLGTDNAVLCYICSRNHAPAHVCSSVDGFVSLSSQGSALLDTVGLLKGLASRTYPSILPHTLHRDPWPESNGWLWVSASVSVSRWFSLSEDSHARLMSTST